jgi:acyl carrier protein
MDQSTFVSEIENLLEMDAGSLSLETQIKDLETWDSLAFVSFLAIADSTFGMKVSPDELRKAETIADLMKLVSKD